MVQEIGSDFHYCTNLNSSAENEISGLKASFYANGRHALQALIKDHGWKRIWVPIYFCYEVIDAIKETGIIVVFYPDGPDIDDDSIISDLAFKKFDVLMRMNFFGLRSWRNNNAVPVPVIEDHSHDLIGDWASRSNADWCFASLRKTVPLPEGGVLWSPKKHRLPLAETSSNANELLTYKRLSAMLLKTLYLSGNKIDKNTYRQLFIESERAFCSLTVSSISELCFLMFKSFDIRTWYKTKARNWNLLANIKSEKFKILIPEDIEKCNAYSLILKFQNKIDRNNFRKVLIEKNIYPAIIWEIPAYQGFTFKHLSETVLSIYCDARYDEKAMRYLKKVIVASLR